MDRAVIAAVVAQLLDEEAEEEERVAMALARIAAEEIMELEEGEGFEDAGGASWVKITVNINEFHLMNDIAFKLHFRMTRTVFEAFVVTIRNHLVEKNRLKRERRPLQDILLMFLWIMATPDCFRSVALRFGVRPSTLHYFYTYIIEALRELAPTFISWPNAAERVEISNTFERASGFPGIIGSIDGTHVPITAPVSHPVPYFNRHHCYSINVQAVVDANLMVRHLHVGEPGSMHDSRVFRRSPLYSSLINDPNGDFCNPINEHLVGDGAYTLTDFMMIPFPNNGHLTPQQKTFNRALSQCRVRVENAFARGKGKWRRLKMLHARNPKYVVDHITASFVLHNYVISHGQQLWDVDELDRPIRDAQVLGREGPVQDDGNVHEAQAAAEDRGAEKRTYLMNRLAELNDQDEDEDEDDVMDFNNDNEEDIDDPEPV